MDYVKIVLCENNFIWEVLIFDLKYKRKIFLINVYEVLFLNVLFNMYIVLI